MTFMDTCMNRAQTSVLQIYDMETGAVQVLRKFDRVIEAPNWIQDGKSLIYNSWGTLYRFDLETKESIKIDTGIADTCNNDHVPRPNGRGIGVSSGRNGDLLSRIYTVDYENGEVKEIVSEPYSYLHGWSPDDKNLAYCAGRRIGEGEELEWDIYTIPVAGGEETRLTDAPGLNDGAEYSRDGNYIWFNSTRTGLMQVWRMDADGNNQTQMTFAEDRNSWFPHISPDGKTVVFLSYHKDDLDAGAHLPDLDVEIRAMPATGGDERTLLKIFGGQGSINVNSWSPNSKKFAFVSYEK